ncbi:MAG: rhodanese-like domain-containing protein [Methyloprofundus sp.]|nr:rhodanese-like domain-containing protein [Methyloprofundus sp.]MDT8426350.1 rhodanese-like domain-containing protein [Methyloprofundus sp.]
MIENLTPQQSWTYMQENPSAVLIDVRTKVEHHFVGHPLSAVHIPWKESPDWQVNAQFVEQIKVAVNNDLTRPVLLLCRSGQRSLDAAQALEEAGFAHSINILDGFEGALDDNKHRGNLSGWRYCQLPWEQS